MMKENINLNPDSRMGDGMTVPDGYFADFALRMEAALPERERPAEPVRRTRWQIIRPYAYMAAMFAGIWCMLQMFAMMGGAGVQAISPDTNPVLAEAIGDDSFMDDYYYMTSVDEVELMEDLYASGLDITNF